MVTGEFGTCSGAKRMLHPAAMGRSKIDAGCFTGWVIANAIGSLLPVSYARMMASGTPHPGDPQ